MDGKYEKDWTQGVLLLHCKCLGRDALSTCEKACCRSGNSSEPTEQVTEMRANRCENGRTIQGVESVTDVDTNSSAIRVGSMGMKPVACDMYRGLVTVGGEGGRWEGGGKEVCWTFCPFGSFWTDFTSNGSF